MAFALLINNSKVSGDVATSNRTWRAWN